MILVNGIILSFAIISICDFIVFNTKWIEKIIYKQDLRERMWFL